MKRSLCSRSFFGAFTVAVLFALPIAIRAQSTSSVGETKKAASTSRTTSYPSAKRPWSLAAWGRSLHFWWETDDDGLAAAGPFVPWLAISLPDAPEASLQRLGQPAPQAAGDTSAIEAVVQPQVAPAPQAAGGNLDVNATGYTVPAGGDIYATVHVGVTSSGAVTHSAGTLTVTNELDLGYSAGRTGRYNLSGGTLAISSNGLLYVGADDVGTFVQTGGAVTVGAGGEVDLGSNSVSNNTMTYTISAGSLNTPLLLIGDQSPALFTQSGTSTVTTASSIFTGLQFAGNANAVYQLNGGTLSVAGVTSPIVINTGTFNFNGGLLQASASDNPGPNANNTFFLAGLGAANVQGSGARVDTNGFNVTISQALLHAGASTDGGLTKSGAGILTLTGANTYTGPTVLSTGTLQLGSGSTTGTLSTSSAITANGTLVFNRSNAVTQGTDFSGAGIGGTGGVTKIGAGNLTLNADNTYGGSTVIGAGTLTVNNNSSTALGRLSGTGAIVVNNGGTLLLSGALTATDRLNNAAAVTVNGGGKFSTGALNEGAAPTAAAGAGGAVGIGSLTLAATTSALRATFDFGATQTGSALVFGAITASSKGAFVSILNFTGAANADNGLTSNDRLLFTSNPGFSLADLANWQFFSDSSTAFITGGRQIAYNGYYEIVPVPEPVTWMAGGLTVLLALNAWRRQAR